MSVRKKLFTVLCILGIGAVGIVAAQTWGQNPSYFLEALIRWDLQIRPQNTIGPTPFQLYNPSGTLVDSIDANGNMTAHTLTTPSLTVGSGPAMTQAPVIPWSIYLPTYDQNVYYGLLPLSANVTITRVAAQASVTQTGCTANPTISVVKTTDTANPLYTLTPTATDADSGAISISAAAGATLEVGVTNPSGCTSTPAEVNVTVQYQMQ